MSCGARCAPASFGPKRANPLNGWVISLSVHRRSFFDESHDHSLRPPVAARSITGCRRTDAGHGHGQHFCRGFWPSRRHPLDHGYRRRSLFERAQPRSFESNLAGARSCFLVGGTQGAGALCRAWQSRVFSSGRRGISAPARLRLRRPPELLEGSRRRSLERLPWAGGSAPRSAMRLPPGCGVRPIAFT